MFNCIARKASANAGHIDHAFLAETLLGSIEPVAFSANSSGQAGKSAGSAQPNSPASKRLMATTGQPSVASQPRAEASN